MNPGYFTSYLKTWYLGGLVFPELISGILIFSFLRLNPLMGVPILLYEV